MPILVWALQAVLLVLITIGQAVSEEFTVHGPDEFVRHYGQPIKKVIEFTAPVSRSDYILRVHNGWGDARRVKAARIILNGQRVLGPRDFHKGMMDHYDFGDLWSKERRGLRWSRHRERFKQWDLSETILIDKAVSLQEVNTLEVIVYGIPQKTSGFLSGFLKKIHGYLPSSWQEYLNNGSGLAVEFVGVDGESPIIVAGTTPLPNVDGWHRGPVAVSFECTDDFSGIVNCSELVTVSQDGSDQSVVGKATDLAGNTSSTETLINLDSTSPQISHALSPAPNEFGWANQSLAITYVCSDELSGIKPNACPEKQTVDQEGKDQQVAASVSDIAGNTATDSLQVNIDKSVPSVVINVSPEANSAGWHKNDVSIGFFCEDTLSGVQSCPQSRLVVSEGLSMPFTGLASDFAGNAAEASVFINLDKTPPVVSTSYDPQPNAKGWHKSDVTLTFQCSDALSGLVLSGDGVCPEEILVSTDGFEQSIITSVTDVAGNSVAVSTTLNLDKTAPAILPKVNPAKNAAGWHNKDVTVGFECTDALSGIERCSEAQVISAEGANLNIKGLAHDIAGNVSESQVVINLDKTAPEILPIFSSQPNAGGWYNSSVTLSYQCSDTLSGLPEFSEGACPAETIISSNGFEQAVVASISDKAGNSATVTSLISIDTVSPTLAFTSPLDGGQLDDPMPIITLNLADNLYLDESSFSITIIDDLGTATAACGLAAGTATCSLSRELVGQADLTAQISDLAGNTVSQTISVAANTDSDGDGILDHSDNCPNTLPGYEVGSDGCDETQRDSDEDGVLDVNDAFPHDASETSDLDGDGIGDNSDSDIDGDNVPNGTDLFPEDPKESSDMDGDGIGDNGDEDRDGDGVANASDAYPEDASRSKLPVVTIDSPATLVTVGSSPVQITGTADQSFTTLTVNGVPVSISNGEFSAQVTVAEGFNTIVARAVDDEGLVSTASISVSLDLTPPYVTIDSHDDGQVVYSDTIMVSGLINDIVRGTVEAEQASVTVNGNAAEISNRSYRVEGLPLTEGDNTLIVIGRDQVGNATTEVITVTYKVPTGNHILVASGQNQMASINDLLPEPLMVKVVDSNGTGVPDKNVVFRVTQGSGVVLSASDEEARAHVVKTDSSGIASIHYRLGQRAGASNHKVDAKVVGYENYVTFYASATGSIGNKISVNSGNNQRGSVFQPLPAPFIVAVTDIGNNVVQNARVKFEATVGGGTFEGGTSSIIVLTDSDGRAAAQMTLGSQTGLDQQRVVARLLDAPEGENLTAGFTATGFYPQEPAKTSISGTVLDNQDKPLPNVTVIVDGTTRQAKTDAEGIFKITEAPVGPVHLIIDGSTTTAEGEYPTLTQNIVTVSGVDNPLAAPVYMVKLNTDNAVWAGKEDVAITLPEVPGFKLEIEKDSVTFPDGSREGQVSVTTVNASKVPMAPPNGMQPQFIVTIQPTGTRFDPPARLTLPNVDAYTPGAQVEMFSYDHDLEEFVAIGLGSVSDDGMVITSNEGVGVIKAGWHCGAEPGGAGSCGNDDCEGPSCDDEDDDDKGPPDCSSGNPINLATGEKYQVETDFIGPGSYPLTIERVYQSKGHGRNTAQYWSFSNEYSAIGGLSWEQVPCGVTSGDVGCMPSFRVNEDFSKLRITEPNGKITKFDLKRGPWEYKHENGGVLKVTDRRYGWLRDTYVEDYVYIKTSGEKIFIENRRVTRVEDSKGNYKAYSVVGNNITITDQFGNKVDFTKDENGNTVSATYVRQDDEALVFTYEYDDEGRLVKAIYPDDKFKQYHYENERLPNALTGITDESGVRYATWQYDNFGRAILSEHALEAEQKTLRYHKAEPINFDDPDWFENKKWAPQKVTETNELGKETTYTFERISGSKATLIEGHASTSCVAANKEYQYFSDGMRRSKTDWKGNKTRYEYNDRNLETLRVEAEGTPQERRIETEWHDEQPWVVRRNDAGQVTEYEYDEKGNMTKLTRGSRVLTFSYTDLGQLQKIDGARTDVTDETHYEYSAAGNLVRQTNTLGHVVHLQDYNLYNQPTRIVDANGVVTLLEYDQRGRLSKSTVKSRDGDAVTSYVTNAVGLVTKITPSNGSAIDFEYDDARRLIVISNKEGERIEYSVDAMGNRTEERILDGSGALAYRHVNLFDELGRLIKDVGTNEQINIEKYDVNGNVVESIDGNGNPTAYAFDPLDRLVSSTNANNHTAQFAYDNHDNLTSVADQRGLTTQYEYNEHNEIVKLISPDTGTTTFVRDSAGNIISKIDARGVVTNYTYDAINRLLTKTFPSDATRNITYRYDDQYTAADATATNYNAGKGRLTYVSDHTGNTRYRYDDRGNVISDMRTIKVGAKEAVQETLYGYDLANQLIQMDYPTGIRLYFVRDDLGRINQIKLAENASVTIDKAAIIADSINYLPFGAVTSLNYGNGLNLNREFDRDYRITNIEVSDALKLIYEYDTNNNIVAIDNDLIADQSAAFGYDVLNRLQSEQKNQNQITYEYDEVGNRTLRKLQEMSAANDSADQNAGQPVQPAEAIETAYTYAANSNQLKTVSGNAVSHDAVGNIVSLPASSSQHTSGEATTTPALSFTFDAVNRLSKVSHSGQLQASYFYNTQGQRVLKQLHSASREADYIVYHYNLNGQFMGESHYKAGAATQHKTYVWLGNMPVAMLDKVGSNDLVTTYIHTDHLNTPRTATNRAKAVVWNWLSDAFGDGLANNDVDGNGELIKVGLRFPGQIFDAESNNHYNYFRDYNPTLGRYIESDPVGLSGGFNTYLYVEANSINLLDFYGLRSVGGSSSSAPTYAMQNGFRPQKVTSNFNSSQYLNYKNSPNSLNGSLQNMNDPSVTGYNPWMNPPPTFERVCKQSWCPWDRTPPPKDNTNQNTCNAPPVREQYVSPTRGKGSGCRCVVWGPGRPTY